MFSPPLAARTWNGAWRVRGLNKLAREIITCLGPLKKEDVAAGDLSSVMAHLQIMTGDSAEVLSMKESMADLRVLMEVLLVIKESKELVTYLKA